MVGKLSPLRLGALIAALALMVVGGYAGVKYTMAYLFPDAWEEEEDEVDDGLPADQMNLLLLGIDARKDEVMARADSIIFVHADTRDKKVAMMSIPRDTRVEIPGRGNDKINSTTIYGGPDMAREVVSDLLGVPVPYYVAVDFEGFKEIVDILGGVTIDVEKRMYYRDPRDTPPLLIDLYPGEQRLDGEKAMGYVRWRGDGLADISRTQRQQKFLMALADEMLQAKSILKLPKLIPELRKNVDTNLSLRSMVKWAGMARKLGDLQMMSATLPGTFWDNRGISYWYVDPVQAKVALADLVAGKPPGDPINLELVPPTPTVTPRPGPAPQPADEENGPDPDGPVDQGAGEGDEAGGQPGDPVLPEGPADGEGPPEEDVPGWTPVEENPAFITEDGRGRDHHRPRHESRPAPGANVEYGSRTEEAAAAGG